MGKKSRLKKEKQNCCEIEPQVDQAQTPALVEKKDFIVCLLLLISILTVYWPTSQYDFIHTYDDEGYVTENENVKTGLQWNNILWAFTTSHESNWHPLTWISHMVDCELFGLNPGMHHLTNVFFHILNSLLLYIIFKFMTQRRGRSALLAAIFALHPMHVESVAWIAERKDVLSTFWGETSILAYYFYSKKPDNKKYALVLAMFFLSLLSKAMLVTLPFVLVLFDYWPLRRLQSRLSDDKDSPKAFDGKKWAPLVIEKIPMISISLIFCYVTYYVQKLGGSVASLEQYSFPIRLANAFHSYIVYIWKFFLPVNLAVLYPHPGEISSGLVIISVIILLSLTVLAVLMFKKAPYIMIGWLIFLGTLVPVIGLVQVGAQAYADRYTYVPYIGLLIIVVWGFGDIFDKLKLNITLQTAAAVAVVFIMVLSSASHIKCWSNDISLFKQAIAVTKGNYRAYNNLGYALAKVGNVREAISHYQRALEIMPNYATAHINMGSALVSIGKLDEAKNHMLRAVEIKSDSPVAHFNLGNVFEEEGRFAEAIVHYREAIRLKPKYVDVYNNLAIALFRTAKIDEAILCLQRKLALTPNDSIAQKNLEQMKMFKQQAVD